MRTRNRGANRLFLVTSLIILTSDALFVWINYQSSREAMLSGLAEEMQESRNAFELAMDATESMLQQTASYIAGDTRVQQLFLQGKRAVAEEGGGAGKQQAAQARNALYDLVGKGWKAMQENYQVRQLHFHLGPGSTSFLRVHRPEKFGDNMDRVRYTIVDANTRLIRTRGFETGRVYSGIRGVIPVFAEDPVTGLKEHVGALEAGTSFSLMFKTLKKHTGVNFAVLLTPGHMKANVWPDFLDKMYRKAPPVGGYYLEATNDEDGLRSLISQKENTALVVDNKTDVLATSPPIAVSTEHLRDYKGSQDSTRYNVGHIVLWRDASEAVAAFEESLYTNIAYAIAAFIILELVLYFGIRAVTRHLEQLVGLRSGELAEANAVLRDRNSQLADTIKHLHHTRDELVESEKMASLGRLVAGVAHEANTPINNSLTASKHLAVKVEALDKHLQEGALTSKETNHFMDALRLSTGIVTDNLDRAAALIRNFKQVAVDRTSEEQRSFQLCEYIEKVVMSLQPRLKNTNHRLHISCTEDIQVSSYPGAFSQILSNLVINSLHHAFPVGEQGNIFIEVEGRQNERGILSYKDDGTGIPAQNRDKIFEPLFTTRRDSGGSGLGLSVVYNLVTETLGGSIRLDGEGMPGTHFIMEFPINPASMETPPPVKKP